jgi:uncharacterized protein DUF1302
MRMRLRRFGGRWQIVTLLLMAVATRPARAIYIDEQQNWSLRARVYSQFSVRAQDSTGDTLPETKSGQLVQNRNFFNPELDAKLTDYLNFMKDGSLNWLVPDELRGRVAGWLFYDGIYDYGSSQFGQAQSVINSTFNNFTANPRHAWFLEGASFECPVRDGGSRMPCVVARRTPPPGQPFADVFAVFPGATVKSARDEYAHQERVNEAYLSYSKGPVFLRVGRQAISWGESDTIAILDQNNPFDLTLGAPGVFEDLDEARIPLWTLRGSLNLFDTLGPLSSGFVEAYWVPGDLDANTGFLPIPGASPYSIPQVDPQELIPSLVPGGPPIVNAQVVLLDRVPGKKFSNSRWGVRTQTVVARDYTVSAWFYTTFPNGPVPQSLGLTTLAPQQGLTPVTQPNLFTIQTVHFLTPVVGVATTFFSEPLDGIIRLEAEYFNREPAFIPTENVSVQPTNINPPSDRNLLKQFTTPGTVPRADYLRWELGFDRFFFVRPINPTNSFTFVGAMVGSWNVTETFTGDDFRQNGQLKPIPANPNHPWGTESTDYVDLYPVEVFFQGTLQTDYMHGKLQPRVTYIQNVIGTYGVLPSIVYRWSDSLLFQLSAVKIGGQFSGLGFFADRSQVSARVTYQLN